MKRFDYNCKACKFLFEYIQDTHEESDNCPYCPSCGSKRVVRELCRVAVHNFYSPMHPRHKRGMCGKSVNQESRPLFTYEDLPNVRSNKRPS